MNRMATEILTFTLGLALFITVLLLGIYWQGQGKRNRLACTANLEQLGKSMQIYISESFFGTLPTPENSSADARAKALGKLKNFGQKDPLHPKSFICPSTPEETSALENRKVIEKDADTSYDMIDTRLFPDPFAIEANRIIIADQSERNDGKPTRQGFYNHSYGQNCLYMDGHVEFVESLTPENDSEKEDIYASFWPQAADPLAKENE